jgi:hypothetical protein
VAATLLYIKKNTWLYLNMPGRFDGCSNCSSKNKISSLLQEGTGFKFCHPQMAKEKSKPLLFVPLPLPQS